MASAQAVEASDPERRSAPRTEIPSIRVCIGGEPHIPVDWGLGGCRIKGYKGGLRPGDSVVVELFLNIDQDHTGLPVDGEITRFDEEEGGLLAVRFKDLNAELVVDFCSAANAALGAELAKK